MAAATTLHQLKSTCSSCSLRELCLPMGLTSREVEQIDHLVATRRRVKGGESLYRVSDPFGSIYAVRSGFFKSTRLSESGRDQVTGFYMAGEILGIDVIGTDKHACNIVA